MRVKRTIYEKKQELILPDFKLPELNTLRPIKHSSIVSRKPMYQMSPVNKLNGSIRIIRHLSHSPKYKALSSCFIAKKFSSQPKCKHTSLKPL